MGTWLRALLVMFIVRGVFALAVARRCNLGRKSLVFSQWSATLAFCCALAAIVPLGLCEGQLPIYLGYGVWVASLLALALGSWRLSRDESTVCQQYSSPPFPCDS